MTHLLQQAQTHKNNAPIQGAEGGNSLTQRTNLRDFLGENRALSMHRALSSEGTWDTPASKGDRTCVHLEFRNSFRNSDSAGRIQKRAGHNVFSYL